MKLSLPQGLAWLMLLIGALIVALSMLVRFEIPALVVALWLIIMSILGLTGH
jgi:hypothetical protein